MYIRFPWIPIFILWSIVMLLGLVAFALKIVFQRLVKAQVTFPYEKEPVLFTPAERRFLAVLDQALGDQFRVLGKVRFADVIRVKAGLDGRAYLQAFRRIQSKHLDFVVCDANDFSVQCVVELDDSSHLRARRQARDEFVDRALAAAGVSVFRFPVRPSYSVKDIQEAIFDPPPPERQACASPTWPALDH